ncbi:MAG: signal peptidase II [Alicyclobacillus sp.]|nr:signal peptidase II [Alicyclobacillus sp.]
MIYGVALLVFALDQVVKWWIRTHLLLGQALPVAPPWLYIHYIRNPGGAFGILPGARWLFVLVALLVVGAVVWADRRFSPGRWTKLGLAFLLAGALGNLTDRALTGTVVDYVDVAFIHFPVFNLADVAIDVGIALLLLQSARGERARRQTEPPAESPEER